MGNTVETTDILAEGIRQRLTTPTLEQVVDGLREGIWPFAIPHTIQVERQDLSTPDEISEVDQTDNRQHPVG